MNQMFPTGESLVMHFDYISLEILHWVSFTEASLSGVEPLMQKIHGEIRRVDASILSAVRQQSNSGTKAKEDLADATRAVELSKVKQWSKNIKKLDFAKKNLTTTITALHRLTMLVSAVEQLQVMASKKQYREAAAQLEVPFIFRITNTEIGREDTYGTPGESCSGNLVFHLMKLFSFKALSSSPNLLQHLSDCCLVVDALESSVREEVVNNFCSRELTSYEQIFEGAELARLDKTERRYAWIKRRIRTNEEIWKIFPASWHVPYRLCIQFCKKTRKQVESILVNMKEKPEVATLLQALQSTVEFEKELENKFGGDVATRDIGDDIEEIGTWENSSQNVSKIRKKYEKKFAAGQESGESGLLPLFQQETTGNKDLSVPGAGFNFRGIISSCFEPHLTPYIELEEKTLMEHLEKVVQEETWDIEYGSQNNVLHSSTQLFTDIKKSLKRCSVLSKNQTLFNLFKVFQRVLKAYATKLFLKLPKGGTGIVAAATGMDGQIKVLSVSAFFLFPMCAFHLFYHFIFFLQVSDRDERVICHIVNSSEYCHKTCGELAEKVSEIIDPHYVDVVDMSEVQDEFSAVITRSLVTLVLGIETKFDTEMAAMTRVPWGALDSVGDQSGYVNGINTILSGSIPVLGTF
ncbi:hypothetical protein Bca52824_017245 [Brassica carinata]|uniref:Vps53 N-terminal domain-containing protein n=1 Tax=Brassica carinata TaxID=52824 RepID=A0A8X8AX84_BRACI|nr:hypothetical protein Bca52824_017245 [Brassica carinata]